MTMSSSLLCQSPFFPMPSHQKSNQPTNTAQLLRLSRNQPNSKMRKDKTCMKTKAIPITTSLLLGVASPGKPDLPVFLGVSAGLFFVYWIANFAVPELVMKDLLSDQGSEDPKPDVENNLVDFDNLKTSVGSESESSQTKKNRRFKSTKR